MNFYSVYNSPIGALYLVSDGTVLTGLFFDAEKILSKMKKGKENVPAFDTTKRWLDIYFSGKEPDFLPPIKLKGTPFREEVWKLLGSIPYGTTVSYGDLAKVLAARHGKKMSAQAVGGAVGKNPISIIIPCHRVIGANGKLIGYGGGLDKKKYLLELEGIQSNN